VHAVLAVYAAHAVFTLATTDWRKEGCMAWHGMAWHVDTSPQQASFKMKSSGLQKSCWTNRRRRKPEHKDHDVALLT